MASVTRRELHLGMDALVPIDLEPGNGGIVLGMSENGMRISVAYPLARQAKVRFTLHLSPKQKISGMGIVNSISSTGRSAEVEILELDEGSRKEFDGWLGGSPAEAEKPEAPKPLGSPLPSHAPEIPSAVPVLETEQPILILEVTPLHAMAEPIATAAPAEEHVVETQSQRQTEPECATTEVAESAQPNSVSAPEAIFQQDAEKFRESLSAQQLRASESGLEPATQQTDNAPIFPVLLDGVTDAAATQVAHTPGLLAGAKPVASQKTVQAAQAPDAYRSAWPAAAPENPVKRVVPFAASVPARPAAEPEPGEEDDFAVHTPEVVAVEEGPTTTALYLPNYNVEGITSSGTDWRWKENLYSLPPMALLIAGQKFEEFGWSLERDWHIWLALAMIGAGFLPLVMKPPLVPVSLVLWLAGARVAIKRRQPEHADERG